ncbi:RND family transporter [Variovorax sp. Sphag1AA]|uniref:efflux RND transporter permease subunit n=1 Tax=Variovorax sp. Sphag1AA TaxID=2587027 RepID=UPI0016129730|nr:MMPL family transporter [Variovorax sp. Sphag1AA]MBB3178000.1 hypothetical protein [Variovorax sp. Sphag1AA]
MSVASDTTAQGALRHVERLIFGHRRLVLLLCALLTAVLAWQATRVQFNASFEQTLPISHPFVRNFLAHQSELRGLGNAVRVAVANPRDNGSIYDAAYLEVLRRLSDEVFLVPGVNRAEFKSLWTASTRWVGVTEDGLEGGPVIPAGYDGGPDSLRQLADNIARSGEIGQLVALDARSSAIYVPLLAQGADGKDLDYGELARRLEALRAKYEQEGVRIHITGYAKIVGDLIAGLHAVLAFFAVAVIVATAWLYGYTRCRRSTLIVVSASLVAVVWLLGLLPLLGMRLGPYSVLVPFLVFAIGMSHGAQKMNGIMQDIGRGADRLEAARMTFRRLFLAGLAALLADVVGFAVLLVIDIPAIRELALAASLGVATLIVTNLILIPVLLSYVGVSPAAARRSLRLEADGRRHRLWDGLLHFTRRGPALAALVGAVILGLAGAFAAQRLAIGDLDAGAPELRPDSRYNRDAMFMAGAYGASSDVLAVMVATPDGRCSEVDTVRRLDTLEWELRQVPGVEGTSSLAQMVRRTMTGLNEGHPKWYDVVANQDMVNTITAGAPRGLYNDTCNLLTLHVYLADHKAQTLQRVVDHVRDFAAANDSEEGRFLLAAGSAGMDAATNMAVASSWRVMLWLVYGAVCLLAWIAFRSWRAVLVAVLPLVLTSVLAEALMVALHIGVKVATLPVVALGVGIGVDYALYILTVLLAHQRAGEPLAQAFHRSLLFTGRVVMLTGLTLATGVFTWIASPIKFQADMGILLAFMFLWNMLGALVLLPALARFLLPDGMTGLRYSPAIQGERSIGHD